MQLMIGYVYFGAAITKMHTPAYFSGDQLLFWVNTHINHVHPIGEYFNFFPWLLGIFAYIAIVWEVVFVFLAWRGVGRYAMLSLGVVFHLGTTFIIGLYIFPMVCYSAYLAFVNEEDIRWATRCVQRWKRQPAKPRPTSCRDAWTAIPEELRFPAPIVFALTTALVMVAGVRAEYALDPNGQRRAEGPPGLKPIPAERVHQLLLTGAGRIAERDKLFAFDIGTTTIGGVLVDHKSAFATGDCFLAQCTFVPPHEDMWVQCSLHDVVVDETGQVIHDQRTEMEKLGATIDEQGGTLIRSDMRINFRYSLKDSLEPGTYALVLRVGHEELARRVFRVTPN